MASIFRKDDNYVDKPNRNTFDLSFQNNLTTRFGRLIPCYCQEVIPGDSFKIQPTFGLRYLPQVFPVQTRMRANLHFFYVRNRTIWKDWMDFIGKTKDDLVSPYLTVPTNVPTHGNSNIPFVESSIFDYMGLPVTLNGLVPLGSTREVYSNFGTEKYVIYDKDSVRDFDGYSYSSDPLTSILITSEEIEEDSVIYQSSLSEYSGNTRTQIHRMYYYAFDKPINYVSRYYENDSSLDSIEFSIQVGTAQYKKPYLDVELITSRGHERALVPIRTSITQANMNNYGGLGLQVSRVFGYCNLVLQTVESTGTTPNETFYSIQIPLSRNEVFLSELQATSLPYGGNDGQIRISALPFRAYEAVYNSFYRNAENNPFIVDGVPEYNRYVKSLDGGAQDANDFHLFNRNWEDDAFTTAVPTPQQGNAPLVGLSTNGEPVSVKFMNEDGTVNEVNLTYSNDGTINAVSPALDSQGNPVGSVADGLNVALNDAINFGITINDLRNVNALQLWLEKNVRKGYKYRDQIMSHFGISVDYDDLMMPEFIGGVSRDVTVNQISQTVETETGNLGDMAGQAYVVGEGHSIQRYCDEHGFIIGILSVTPVPNYSQMIPKHLFKLNTFDYFFPEFGKIGMQPILKKEIAAIPSWLEGSSDETFGYQRAWYDYLARVDEVHGKFNTDFYNFLLQRKFSSVPELGASFTTVQNEHLNNIFYTDSDEDKILGQIYFDVSAKRPIPLYGIPSLE